jgi:hypothetical protein
MRQMQVGDEGSHQASLAHAGSERAYWIQNMRCGFADQFQVAQSGVVVQSAGLEGCLIQSMRVRQHLFSKIDHVA